MPRLRTALLTALFATACAGDAPIVLGTAGRWDTGYGSMAQRGMTLALDEINADGGVRGRPLELLALDDRASGAVAAQVADSLVRDRRVVAVVGHLASGAMMAATPVYDAGRLPAVSTTASTPELTGASPWVFRLIPSDAASGRQLGRFATSLRRQRAAILYENDAYGRGLSAAFRESYAGEIASEDPIASAPADFEPYLSFYKSRGVDLVFVAGTEASGAAFVRQARAAGLAAALIGGDGWAPIAGAPEADGAWIGVAFTARDPRPEVQRFVRAFRTRFGTDPDNNAALAYDAVHLLAAVIAAVGPDRDAIRRALADGFVHAGITGTIRLGPDGDPVDRAITIARVRAGSLDPQAAP
jgi:branched-chain amino acid transport system substrate-binding protein